MAMATSIARSSTVPSLPPPSPKSPPEYPDLYGKRREMARVQMIEREISYLEEELKSVQGLQPASRCCKEIAEFVLANSDPLLPTTKKNRRSCRFWKWLCRLPCFNLSWICCCSCHECCASLELPRCCCGSRDGKPGTCGSCDCKPCTCGSCDCKPCTCGSCHCKPCTCPSISCSIPRWHCCSCPKSDCCKCHCSSCCSLPNCCIFRFPSCSLPSCCTCKCLSCGCPSCSCACSCPKVSSCCCTKSCWNSCCLCC